MSSARQRPSFPAGCARWFRPSRRALGCAFLPGVSSQAASINRVGIVGAGFMGIGIAESVAAAGLHVVVRDVDEAALERAREAIERSLHRAVQRGKLSAEDASGLCERIELTTEWQELRDADLLIEAVPEVLELKVDIMAQIEEIARPDAVIASNTSSIPIAQLAAPISHRERVVGLHFFSPVPVMKLVEVVRGLDTSDETIETARAFAERLDKRPIVTKDRSGFIVNMLLVPYLMAAVRMYEDGFASGEDIDAGMQLGCGHPMGPLALCDFIGLDVLYSVCTSLFDEFKRDEYAPPPLMKRMVASGRLGRKSGQGFHEYGA